MLLVSEKALVASGSFLRVTRALCLTLWLTDLFAMVVVGIGSRWEAHARVLMMLKGFVSVTGVFATF
jgi:hypothetical protein